MLEADPQGLAAATIAHGLDRTLLRQRIESLGREITHVEQRKILAIVRDENRSLDGVRDAVSTRLMEVFRQRTNRSCFGLLYELNCAHLLAQVSSCLRRYGN